MVSASVCAPWPPLLAPGTRLNLQIKCSDRFSTVRVCSQINPISLGLELQPIVGRSRKQSFSVICAADALNSTCITSGQTQTVTREAPTITQVPVHSKEMLSHRLDGGNFGFSPSHGDRIGGGGGNRSGGGGGRGGGGGDRGYYWGGFFLFEFLAFLSYLTDKESEEDYR